MNKKTLSLLLVTTLASCCYKLPINAFDLKKEVRKVTKPIEQEIKKAAADAKEVIEKEIKKPEGFLKKITSIFSLEKLLLANLPLIYILLIAFAIGIAVSFTPCIYPMIPITIGLLQSQASPSIGRNFMLASSYVAGMATVYATLGYVAATTTLILGQWLANPFFIAFLVLLFLYLAFSMFGFYEIYMPRFLQRGTQVKVRGSILYSFIFGAVSGTAASPCLTPALALLLGYVAKRGNPLVGFVTLFVFALGMGLLLIVIGTFSNSITALPRAGTWMNEIKKFFGFLLLGVCVYFLNPFLSSTTSSVLYLSVALIMASYYGFVIIRSFTKK
ncbi:hypothetical protein KKA53_02855 [Candidatus Dependentiae bacterium]|nr:hypothetical protein [Candidatus Dependentiae bacterium]